MTEFPPPGDGQRTHRPLRLLLCGLGGENADVSARLGAVPSDDPAPGPVRDPGRAGEAYRSIAIEGLRFLVADLAVDDLLGAMGVAAAAMADAAVLVCNARADVPAEMARVAAALSLLAVPEIVLAVTGIEPGDAPAEPLARMEKTFGAATLNLALPKTTAIVLLPTEDEKSPSETADPSRSRSLAAHLSALSRRMDVGAETVAPSTAAGSWESVQDPAAADQFSARLLWLDDAPMVPGRDYVLRTVDAGIPATVTTLRYRVDRTSGARASAKMLAADELGVCNLSLRTPIALGPFAAAPTKGCFILCERLDGDRAGPTLGVGTIRFALRRSSNVQWQALDVTKSARAAAKGQKPAVLWLTGLSGSGKSTVANRIERRLHHLGCHTYLLDGDNVRHGLNRDLGFTEADRVENIRRVAEVARLFTEAGLIVLVSFISPFRSERRMARELMPAGEFVEIFVDTPIEECARRDPKGLYAKAMRGEIKNFTGIDSPYEPPLDPDLRLTTVGLSPDDLAAIVERYLRAKGIVG